MRQNNGFIQSTDDSGAAVFTAKLHPRIRQYLSDQLVDLKACVLALGSPLHCLFPELLAENIASFIQLLDKYPFSSRLLFAKKANKAACFAAQCADSGIGVDVASVGELKQALAAGVVGVNIAVSGPAKSRELLRLSIFHQCMIAIDSLAELRHVLTIAQHYRRCANIVLRYRPDWQTCSRFGLNEKQVIDAMHYCQQHVLVLSLLGFSFHLSGYSIAERGQTAHRVITFCLQARRLGLKQCHSINIGGGFLVDYLEDNNEAVTPYITPKNFHTKKVFKHFYPYKNTCSGPAMLDEIVQTPFTIIDHHDTDYGLSLAQRLARHHLTLMLEPGRALLDQCGISLFRIVDVKDIDADYLMLTVAGTSFSLSEQWFNSEFLPSPLLLVDSMQEKSISSTHYLACVGGSSCLEDDMLSWRKIAFPRLPAVGDILVYINTAAYQMDSNESAFHDCPIPTKIVLTDHEHGWRWSVDQL